ncbi:cadherin-87A [Bombyx mori]|uniref:Cadherin domain-containing protein n=1 Tax=Bombyx mori TaxID=7091 RepID=A0A8R2GA59_BOMMO|nr:cadherin-87A [Bombyx mori]
METRWRTFVILSFCLGSSLANMLPVFTQDMNNLPLSESTPVGTVVYTLQGVHPQGLPIKYSMVGSDNFVVDPESGDVTLDKPLDREVDDTLKFLVSIEAADPQGQQKLIQKQPVTVIVLDENDNPPTFKNNPYEVDVPEDEAIGTTILNNILVEDKDFVGDNLEVGCSANDQWPEACDIFDVVALNSTSHHYHGALVLKRPLNYNERQFYQFQLSATDGIQNSSGQVEVKVIDVQNSSPMFYGALSGALSEDAPVGTLVLTVQARDADKAQPRPVVLELLTNPLDFFLLDKNTGELRTAKPLDREALDDPSSPLNLTVRATEIVNGSPLISDLTSTVATVTITIKDVNDEPPRFNRREYAVQIPESLPVGTPLPNLEMVVTDTDLGLNSVFGLRLLNEFEAFVVEPPSATGSASVTIRLNSSLDYEDPNQRKFILEVIAEELHTTPKLSSRASVTVTVTDVNDNAPQFAEEPVVRSLSETSPPGTRLIASRATDRDTGRFGTEGIVYELSGNGAELFDVDKRSGVISVAECPTPGQPPCLDYESRKDYFLQYKATDDYGNGQMTVVSLQISLIDANDNAPVFVTPVYKASIDEDAVKFEPELQVLARDVDVSSDIRYSIVGPATHPFWIDPVTGKITVNPESGRVAAVDDSNKIILTVLGTDGVHNATCKVEISIRDVNNHAPEFDTHKYDANIFEDAPIGTEVAAVRATDLDTGINAEIKYAIQKGALDAFAIDNVTGVVTVASGLDYDKRNTYTIQITATDLGVPSLTGTTELLVHVVNVNDKKPQFAPPVQRAEVSADAGPGARVHDLTAFDPEIEDVDRLLYELAADRMIKAVDKNGKEVSEEGIFDQWMSVLPNGTVVVAQKLDRSRAAVLSLPVRVTDTSAPALQQADGELIITIVDVNRYAPVFSQPSYLQSMVEEQPVGTVLETFTATDRETPISAIIIHPPNPYFEIDNRTGLVKTTQRIDYEKVHSINFTLIAFDSGVPQLTTTAGVTVEILNANDEDPLFDTEGYEAKVLEHSEAGTEVVTVHASDKDEGEYGEVRYSLSGDMSLFTIDPISGVVTIAPGADIDREAVTEIWMRAVASDNAPQHLKRSTSVPLHVKVLDINDHAPVFSQKVYKSTIAENLQLDPPAAILQVIAEDKDEGVNGKVEFKIIEQSEPGTFTVDPVSGIIYPARAVEGNRTYQLVVRGADGAGPAALSDTARVDITVRSLNTHAPLFVQPPPGQSTIEIPENAAQADFLITTIKATDDDSGENGRISYYLKVDNQNVGETEEFSLDRDTGELRTKTFLDREEVPEYQLAIAAVDNGSPAQFETLRLLTVVLADEDDNTPEFSQRSYVFNIKENLPPNTIIGTVKAVDKDIGENGKVYYHVLEGKQEGAFVLDRTQGVVRAKISFDREQRAEYSLIVYASNNPILEHAADVLNSIDNGTQVESGVASLKINILDENDNEPKFQRNVYFAGVKHTARINEPILSVIAEDPDLDENGTLLYMIAASNLYKFGASESSGSVVPSPFNISQDGLLMTAHYMSEYNQDRFVLDIIAQEVAPPRRQAKTQVYVWVIDRSALIRMVVSRSCSSSVSGVQKRLADAGEALLVPGRKLPLVQADRRYDDWCEIHLHAVDPTTYQVLPVEKVLENIDSKFDELKDVYHEYGVETLIAASAISKAPDSFDPALAALIALLIVLFTGIVTFVVVCACLKHWVISPPSMQSSKGDSLARRKILEELSTTENPLWLETKLRPYEEQELTMNVFGDQNEQVVVEPAPTDNTYATIQGSRAAERFGDYATLGGESPTPLETALGFQGSTFKPPSPDTPEPPPRPTGLGVL